MYLLTTTENKIEEIEKILDKVKPLTESIARQEFNHGYEVALNEFAAWCYEYNVKFDDAGYRTAKDTVREFLESRR